MDSSNGLTAHLVRQPGFIWQGFRGFPYEQAPQNGGGQFSGRDIG